MCLGNVEEELRIDRFLCTSVHHMSSRKKSKRKIHPRDRQRDVRLPPESPVDLIVLMSQSRYDDQGRHMWLNSPERWPK